MKLRSLLHLAASAALFLPAGRASADEDPGLRVRANVMVKGGPVIIPHAVAIGIVPILPGIQFGAQFNDFVAVYGAMDLDFVFGRAIGTYASLACLVDFTFKDAISIGLGPEFGLLAVSGTNLVTNDDVIGGRLHFAWYPYVYRNELHLRRGLALGMDAHVVAGPPGFLGNSGHSPGSFYGHGSIAFLPIAYVGWSVF